MCSNLSSYQLKVQCYNHKFLYVSLIGTTNHKPAIDSLKLERKECGHTTKNYEAKKKEKKGTERNYRTAK